MNIEEFRKELGHRLKVRRTELGLNQTELAERIGLTQAYISQWELGTRAMRIEQAVVLTQALNTTLGALVGEDNLSQLEL
ncbi:helix-turn-helix domain-containing protein [Allochromatium vinosum]|uniref:Transcriptional regulator, XRE family n=1 Tax=Allochromatium vinosum (strain ATCC 17899 / DSM 180 / NBRC 103801 / NCIMB 10441 / D) TaxID=572477 RepID=D3RW94_ALLVD|nr:helix-turn-helix transcriptional regulator [Allochromatium vinosum]ADC64106.1 transcriptional regulator, XRE family [Allochromatium vinosum DSM 180]